MNKNLVKEIFVPVSEYPHITEDASVKDAFFVLKKSFEEGKGYRSILVMDKKKQLKGTLSLGDLIRAVEPRFLKATKPDSYQGISAEYPALSLIWQESFSDRCREEAKKQVKEAITAIEAAVSLNDPIAKAAYLLVITNNRILPVIDNDNVVGVVRLLDIFNEIASVVLE